MNKSFSKTETTSLLNKIYKLTGIFVAIRTISPSPEYIQPTSKDCSGCTNLYDDNKSLPNVKTNRTNTLRKLLQIYDWVYMGAFSLSNDVDFDVWIKNNNTKNTITTKEKLKITFSILEARYDFLNNKNTLYLENSDSENKANKSAKDKFEKYINTFNQGVIICNPLGEINYFNSAIKYIFNTNKILNKNSVELKFEMYDKSEKLIPKKDYPVYQINKTRIPLENGVFGIKINNSPLIWIKLDGMPLFDEKNNIVEIVFVLEEITNEKVSSDEIVKAMNFLEKTQKIAFLGSFTAMLNEKTWYGNEILFDILGIDNPGVKQEKEWFDLIATDYKNTFIEQLHNDLNSNQTEHSTSFKIIKQNTKEERWVRCMAKIIRNSLGKAETIIGILQDITDIKIAEEKAKENENKYKQILNNVNDVYYKVDWNLNIIDVSPSIKHFTSTPLRRIIGRNLSEFIDVSTIKSSLLKEILTKNKIRDHFLNIKTDGNFELPVSVSATLSFDEKGQPKFIEGFIRDISERLEMESMLRINEDKFRSYIQFSPVAIIVADREGNILESNHALTRLTGYFIDSIQLSLNSPLIATESMDVYNNHAQKIEKFGFATDEITIIVKGGEKKHVRVDSVQIPNGQYLSFITDISYHYKIEEKLRQEQEYLEAAQQIAKVGNAFINFENGTWESSTMLDKIIGFDAIKGNKIENWINVIHPDSFEYVKKYFLFEVIPNRKNLDVDLKIIRQTDGETRWIHAVGKTKYKEDGSIKSMRFTLQDITERKRNEEELIDSRQQIREFAELIQSVREEEKIALAREIHDDLGQMLVALKINIGLLKIKFSTDLHKLTQETINDEMNRILDYTLKTIDTTRKIMTDLRSENIRNLGFIESAENYIQNFNERFKLNCSFRNRLKKINFDQKQTIALYRILQESLNNVVKHANATKIVVSLYKNNDSIMLKISDNGVGFDQSLLPKNNSYGLRGMKERVALLGGSIKISSKPNKGTCVCVEMPTISE